MLELSVRRGLLLFIGGVLLAGLVGGLLWHLLATPPSYTVGDDHGAVITEHGLAQMVSVDIWYVLIGVVLALGLGGLAWATLRRLGWPLVLITIAGALIAGYAAWQFGYMLGPHSFATRLSAAHPGDRVPIDLNLHAATIVLIWPLVACIPVLVTSVTSILNAARRHAQ